MAAKPFTIQSPMQLVMDYKGNKKLIAQAMSTGVVNSLSGVLAGKLIDDIRNSAQAEQAPTQTIAQQIFNPQAAPMGGIGMPAPPAPPMGGIGMPPAPDGASAGLGATPEAAQMQAAMPEMGAPEMAPPEMATPEMAMEEAPMGMAEGGIAALPIPDTMFDEPNNGSYADGGIVAFAAGGETDGQRFERIVTKYIPGTIVTSRQRSVERNKQVGGNPNSFHIPDRARDFVPPKGMSLTEFGARVKAIPELKGTDAVYNSEGHHDHLHLEPGGKRASAPIPREVDTNTFAGRGMSAEDSIALVQSQFGKLPREALDRAKAAALEELDPEKLEKDRKYDMYSALTNFGLNIMSPDDYRGENILGSIAKAAKTTLPQYEASKKERKAAKNAAVRELMALEDVDRKTAIAGVEVGIDVYKTGLSAEQQQSALGFNYAQLAQQASEGRLNREADLLAAKLRVSNPDKFDRIIGAVLAANPGMSELEAMQQAQKLNLLGGSQSGMEGLLGVTPQTGGAQGPQPVLIGSRPA